MSQISIEEDEEANWKKSDFDRQSSEENSDDDDENNQKPTSRRTHMMYDTFDPDEMPILEEHETAKRAESFRKRLRHKSQKARQQKDEFMTSIVKEHSRNQGTGSFSDNEILTSGSNTETIKEVGVANVFETVPMHTNQVTFDESAQMNTSINIHSGPRNRRISTNNRGLSRNITKFDFDENAPESIKTATKLKTLNLINADLKTHSVTEITQDKKEMIDLIHRKNYERKYQVSANYNEEKEKIVLNRMESTTNMTASMIDPLTITSNNNENNEISLPNFAGLNVSLPTSPRPESQSFGFGSIKEGSVKGEVDEQCVNFTLEDLTCELDDRDFYSRIEISGNPIFGGLGKKIFLGGVFLILWPKAFFILLITKYLQISCQVS